MKAINAYINERLVLSKNKSKHYITTLSKFAKLFFSDKSPHDYFSEDNICDCWLLPYEINGVKQDTNPDDWEEGDIYDISLVLKDNNDTEIAIDIRENKILDAWDYSFELEWRDSFFKFCWTSTDDIRNEL